MTVGFATGEAAGIAAALSLRHNATPSQVEVPELQAALRKVGALLPE